MNVRLKRIGVIKTAFLMGLYGFVIGLITGFILGIISSMLGGAVNITNNPYSYGDDILGLGWLNVIIDPLLYGIVSFLASFILIPLMNLILRLINGLDLDMEENEEPSRTISTTQYQSSSAPMIPSRM